MLGLSDAAVLNVALAVQHSVQESPRELRLQEHHLVNRFPDHLQ